MEIFESVAATLIMPLASASERPRLHQKPQGEWHFEKEHRQPHPVRYRTLEEYGELESS
jgi:hypothetical protein